MKTFRTERLVQALPWLAIGGGTIYLICMILVPAVQGDWEYVQEVWDRWQSLNVGVLAFLSSVIALSISRFHAENKREQQFIASRAFLPNALSELCRYFQQSAIVLVATWRKLENPQAENIVWPPASFPHLGDSYKEVFGRCIEFSDADIGEYLALLLMRLQIFNSRMDSLKSSLNSTTTILLKENIKAYLYGLAQLQAMVNTLFNFARGLEQFDSSPLTWEDFKCAYGNLDTNLDLWFEDIEDLEGFTKRTIERERSQ